jgi:Helix-hairpin-helix motif/Pentapeptide repeats (9 copies)
LNNLFFDLFFKYRESRRKVGNSLPKILSVLLSLLQQRVFFFGLICPILISLFLLPLPVHAQSQPERVDLTIELLQTRIHNPILHEGNLTIDLQGMSIDLRPENYLFRDTFYQSLRKELQKTGAKPLRLDLSNSLVQGDFIGSDFGIRTTLYSSNISPTFTIPEQEQIQRLRDVCLNYLTLALPSAKDCRSLLGSGSLNNHSDISVFRSPLTMIKTRFNGTVQFSNTFFLQPLEAQGAIFNQGVNWTEARFSREVNFSNTSFRKIADFTSSIFFDRADFKQAQFQDAALFVNSDFEENANFSQAIFQQIAKFSRVRWWGNADFSQVRFANQVQFTKGYFHQFLLLAEATFEQAVTFREAQFNRVVTLRGASILNQADFSDVRFAQESYLNVSGLGFNSNQAKILGNPGEIGKMLSVSSLQGNQNVLRNLAQNFRQLQQIADMNQLEYTKQQLRLVELSRRLFGTNINSASLERLADLGFSQTQAEAIINHRQVETFTTKNELLTLPDVDFETYIQISDRINVGEPLLLVGWLLQAWTWFALSLLLLLSGYGTGFWLVFGVGLIAIAYFGLIYWLIDKFRRLLPQPIIPTCYETTSMLSSFTVLTFFGFLAIFRNAEFPWLTLGCLLLIIVPIPMILVLRLYQLGRFHEKLDISYFCEDGTMRQLRLLIGRLPVIPRNQSFRDRYMPILWDKRWNWLNYYDFSLNNLLRLGFNDIRLRDEFLPGIIATLAWYQWSLGVLFITLLLWTLSRTIPGLNLLIYLK